MGKAEFAQGEVKRGLTNLLSNVRMEPEPSQNAPAKTEIDDSLSQAERELLKKQADNEAYKKELKEEHRLAKELEELAPKIKEEWLELHTKFLRQHLDKLIEDEKISGYTEEEFNTKLKASEATVDKKLTRAKTEVIPESEQGKRNPKPQIEYQGYKDYKKNVDEVLDKIKKLKVDLGITPKEEEQKNNDTPEAAKTEENSSEEKTDKHHIKKYDFKADSELQNLRDEQQLLKDRISVLKQNKYLREEKIKLYDENRLLRYQYNNIKMQAEKFKKWGDFQNVDEPESCSKTKILSKSY